MPEVTSKRKKTMTTTKQDLIIAEIQSLHKEKHGENAHGPYVICDYDKTQWPCLTQTILHADA